MHYTSWTPRTEQGADLLAESGPEVLAHFSPADPDGEAKVGEETWSLHQVEEEGAQISTGAAPSYSLSGNLKKDAVLQADLAGEQLTLINEQRGDWIIERADGTKIAQFSAGNNGVRKAILEFEPEFNDCLRRDQTIALSWFVRLLLEYRLERTSMALIGTVVVFAIVGILAMILLL